MMQVQHHQPNCRCAVCALADSFAEIAEEQTTATTIKASTALIVALFVGSESVAPAERLRLFDELVAEARSLVVAGMGVGNGLN
jgi:hypothetical protein